MAAYYLKLESRNGIGSNNKEILSIQSGIITTMSAYMGANYLLTVDFASSRKLSDTAIAPMMPSPSRPT